MKYERLITLRLFFSKNNSVGGLKEESNKIFELSEDCVYLLCSDGCENPYDDELINHKLDYYLDPTTYLPKRDDIYQSYFNTNFIPNFDRVFSSKFYQKYRIPEDYTILKIYDVKTLNFFLSVDNDEEIHIFSSDYDISFLETFLDDYYQNIEKYRSIKTYEYVLDKHKDYIASKKFIFCDTYADDEDTNYLLITGNEVIFNKVKTVLGCPVPPSQ